MPSLKPNKGAKKRFKVTARGKVLRPAAGTGHLRAKKSSKRKRLQRGKKLVHSTEVKKIRRLLVT